MQNGDTGFDDVKRDGGMANGRDVDDQRIDLSVESIIIAKPLDYMYLLYKYHINLSLPNVNIQLMQTLEGRPVQGGIASTIGDNNKYIIQKLTLFIMLLSVSLIDLSIQVCTVARWGG